MNKNYEIRSAYVRCRTYPQSEHGVVEVIYGGFADQDVFDQLRDWVVGATKDAPATVLRMDALVDLWVQRPAVPRRLYTSMHVPAGAVIVRAGHYDMWTSYARALAEVGVIRAVFHQENAQLAYDFAERHARRHSGLLTVPSGFASI